LEVVSLRCYLTKICRNLVQLLCKTCTLFPFASTVYFLLSLDRHQSIQGDISLAFDRCERVECIIQLTT
jgi:hypothetical protein